MPPFRPSPPHRYDLGLGFIVANRIADGLDGAIARHSRVSDAGAFLDIALDFIFYAAVPFAFALARPEEALASAFLILSFVAAGSSFLAYAVIAGKRGLTTDLNGTKSIYHIGGLTEGSETFIAFALACLFPNWFGAICYHLWRALFHHRPARGSARPSSTSGTHENRHHRRRRGRTFHRMALWHRPASKPSFWIAASRGAARPGHRPGMIAGTAESGEAPEAEDAIRPSFHGAVAGLCRRA